MWLPFAKDLAIAETKPASQNCQYVTSQTESVDRPPNRPSFLMHYAKWAGNAKIQTV